jgi:hypothetical protein
MKHLRAFPRRNRAALEPARKPRKTLSVEHLRPLYVSRPFLTSESGRGRPLALLIPDSSSLAREALLFPPASRAPKHRLYNAGSRPAFPGTSPLSPARHGSSGPSFLCVFPEIKRRQRERRHVPGTLGPVTRRARPGRVGRRAATRKRIHIETLPHVLDEVGRLLAMRQLFIRFHSAAAARRVLQLFPSKEPARRSSTARRHDTSSSARALSPPPPRLPPGLRANVSRPRPNVLSVGWATPFPGLLLPTRTRRDPPCRLALVFCFLFPASLPFLSLGPAGPQCSAPLVIGRRRKVGVTRKEKVDAVHAGSGRG